MSNVFVEKRGGWRLSKCHSGLAVGRRRGLEGELGLGLLWGGWGRWGWEVPCRYVWRRGGRPVACLVEDFLSSQQQPPLSQTTHSSPSQTADTTEA